MQAKKSLSGILGLWNPADIDDPEKYKEKLDPFQVVVSLRFQFYPRSLAGLIPYWAAYAILYKFLSSGLLKNTVRAGYPQDDITL